MQFTFQQVIGNRRPKSRRALEPSRKSFSGIPTSGQRAWIELHTGEAQSTGPVRQHRMPTAANHVTRPLARRMKADLSIDGETRAVETEPDTPLL
jgi:hypothetical protein